jgi:hypothetical protein
MLKNLLLALALSPIAAIGLSGTATAASIEVHVDTPNWIAFGLPGDGPGYSHSWSTSGHVWITSIEGDTVRGKCGTKAGQRSGRVYLTVRSPNGHTETVNQYIYCPPTNLQ